MSEFAGYEIEVPFGPGPGTINGLDEDRILHNLVDVFSSPAGFAYYGSLTPLRSEGNSGTTYFHDPTTGKTINAMALPNRGVQDSLQTITEAQKIADEYGKPLIISISPGKGDDPSKSMPQAAHDVLQAGAKVIEINYSCPNKLSADGEGRDPILSYDPDMVVATREKILDTIGYDQIMIEKLAPFLAFAPRNRRGIEMLAIIDSLNRNPRGVAGLALSNTIMGHDLILEDGSHGLDIVGKRLDEQGKEEITHSHVGGLSGRFVAPMMREELRQIHGKLEHGFELVSAGGIDSGREVAERIRLGASIACGVTVFWEGEKAGRSYGATARNIAQEYAEVV